MDLVLLPSHMFYMQMVQQPTLLMLLQRGSGHTAALRPTHGSSTRARGASVLLGFCRIRTGPVIFDSQLKTGLSLSRSATRETFTGPSELRQQQSEPTTSGSDRRTSHWNRTVQTASSSGFTSKRPLGVQNSSCSEESVVVICTKTKLRELT